MTQDRVAVMYEEACAQLSSAEASVAYWKQVVLGLSGIMHIAPPNSSPIASAEPPQTPNLPAGEPEAADKTYPRPRQAVENALRSRPNQPMRFPEVWKLIQAEGEADPAIKSGINAYQNSARRLAADPKSAIEFTADKEFVFRTDLPAATPNGASLRGPTGLTGLQPLEGFAS